MGLVILAALVVAPPAFAGTLSLDGNRFEFGGKPFDMNGVRVASASQTKPLTNKLIHALPEYHSYGVNTVAVYLMGSHALNSDPFRVGSDGRIALQADDARRMERIIEAADQRGMVVVLGIFYQNAPFQQVNSDERVEQAVASVAREFKPYRNVVINVANEQNAPPYRERPGHIYSPRQVIHYAALIHRIDPNRIVGTGGYDDENNIVIGKSKEIDALLFDNGHQSTGALYDSYLEAGVPRSKPLVNVELFGGWTKRFVSPCGYYPPWAKAEHYSQVNQVERRSGLYLFFHSTPWLQGPVVGCPIRYALGGPGTRANPGIRWFFEYVKQTR